VLGCFLSLLVQRSNPLLRTSMVCGAAALLVGAPELTQGLQASQTPNPAAATSAGEVAASVQATPGVRHDLPAGTPAFQDMLARFGRWRAEIPFGSGSYKVLREEPQSLSEHTIFRPATLPKKSLPVIAFANGGCRNTPIEFTAFLTEIASYGYIVIAAETDDVDFAGIDPDWNVQRKSM
jgi:hypothetical protein